MKKIILLAALGLTLAGSLSSYSGSLHYARASNTRFK